MALRDERLGKWGLYAPEGVAKIGLKQALRDTIRHLAFGLPKLVGASRSEAEAELRRLSGLADQARNDS